MNLIRRRARAPGLRVRGMRGGGGVLQLRLLGVGIIWRGFIFREWWIRVIRISKIGRVSGIIKLIIVVLKECMVACSGSILAVRKMLEVNTPFVFDFACF